MNLLDKFFITEINLVSQIRPQIKDLTLNTEVIDGFIYKRPVVAIASRYPIVDIKGVEISGVR